VKGAEHLTYNITWVQGSCKEPGQATGEQLAREHLDISVAQGPQQPSFTNLQVEPS